MEGPKSPVSLLIVDDTQENISVLGGILAEFYRVKAATSVKKVLAIRAGDVFPGGMQQG